MAKSKDKKPAQAASRKESNATSFVPADKKALDPTLASLFASSSGPVQAPPKSRYQDRIVRKNDEELSELDDQDDESEDDNDDSSSGSGSDAAEDDEELSELDSEDSESDSAEEAVVAQEKPTKKRKRADKEEIEETYLRKLAREEEKEEEARQKKRKTEKPTPKPEEPESDDDDDDDDDDDAASDSSEDEEADFEIPQHESLAQSTSNTAELEKAARTVFLSNVSSTCINSKPAEKTLKKHLESFIPDLADNTPPHKLESLRYRSTAFDNSLPKRAAFAKKEIMDSTTRSTNAYAVYSTKIAAREAVKRLNGSVLLNRHLHVDSVAHPTKTDHRRCVFVGNLPFVDDETATTPEGEPKKKAKLASDVEEGLWTHFAKAGKIESVRVVRDAATRVGKGFAYVQFYDENAVEAALQFNEKKYPPMLPRKLRVTRCRAEKKNHKKDKPRVAPPSSDRSKTGKAGYVAKLSDEQKSMQGRARSMLGKVAKAQSKDAVVFEGHRAREAQGKSGIKFRGSGGGKKKGVNGRKSRSAAWKKGGAKK